MISNLSQSLFIFIQFKCKQMLYPWVKFLSEEIWSSYSAPNPGFHKGMFAILFVIHVVLNHNPRRISNTPQTPLPLPLSLALCYPGQA